MDEAPTARVASVSDQAEQTNPGFYDDMVREALAELADETFQLDVWTGRNAPGGDDASYIEAVCGMFDDSNLTEVLRESHAYGDPIDELIGRLSSEIDATNEFVPYDQLFLDPHFIETRRLAAEILGLLTNRPVRTTVGNPLPPREG